MIVNGDASRANREGGSPGGTRLQPIAQPGEDPAHIKERADDGRGRQLPEHRAATRIDVSLSGFGRCQKERQESQQKDLRHDKFPHSKSPQRRSTYQVAYSDRKSVAEGKSADF